MAGYTGVFGKYFINNLTADSIATSLKNNKV
jgi:hypothetical protein